MKEFIIANPELCGVICYFVGMFATYYVCSKFDLPGKDFVSGLWPLCGILAVIALPFWLIGWIFDLLDNLAKK